MNLETIIKEELKENIVEARKLPDFKDPKVNLLNEKIVTIADCIRVAEKYKDSNQKVWNLIDSSPKNKGVYDVWNNYPGVQFPIERAFWDGKTFRPINEDGHVLIHDTFLNLTHWVDQMPAPVFEVEDNQD